MRVDPLDVPDPDDEHMWRVTSVSFDDFGTTTEFICQLCMEVLVVGPGEAYPPTV